MANPIPSPLALDLSTITNGDTADATPVESSLAAIIAALNQALTALRGGAGGQFLQATDGADVQWGNAADKSSAATQQFTGGVVAPSFTAIYGISSVVAGILNIASSVVKISATDGSSVSQITGYVAGSQLLYLRNATVSKIPFVSGGGANGFAQNFTIAPNSYAWLVYDATQTAWVCLDLSSVNGVNLDVNPIGYTTGAGAAVTQATSNATAVTINAICGKITTFSGTLAANTGVAFAVNNPAVAAGDTVILSGGPGLICVVQQVGSGFFSIAMWNLGPGGVIPTGFDLNFSVIKAVSA